MIEYILVGLSMSMDAFAVSLSAGMCLDKSKWPYCVRGAVFFGAFQAAMPVAGWFLGSLFASYISRFAPYIAFALLAFIGVRMIIGGVKSRKDKAACDLSVNICSMKTLLALSVATSIDALAVGVSYSLAGHGIALPATFIGVITFAVCLAGFYLGRLAGGMFKSYAQIAGGVVLTGVGVRMLLGG
jgi:putative Mn2+ efflux pump MntP